MTAEPVTKAGEELLTDIINDPEAPSYHVIGLVRRAIPDIEAEASAAQGARIAALERAFDYMANELRARREGAKPAVRDALDELSFYLVGLRAGTDLFAPPLPSEAPE